MNATMNAAIKTGRVRRIRQGLAILLAGLLLTALAFAAARMARLPTPPTIIALALALVPQSASHRRFDANRLTPPPRPQVLRQAGGTSLTHNLEQKLWHPMGAEYAASWSVDDDVHQVEKGFCCINAHAIDFLKFGALYLHQGRAGASKCCRPARPAPPR